jgi:23S rRNA pseudouridine2604 synthase
MTKADNKYEKEYVVTVDKMLTPEFLAKVSENAPPTPGGSRKKSAVTKEGPHRFRIVLEPGTYHNIKRRSEDLGFKVLHLQRVRIATITPTKLSVGMWRTLTEAEVESIKSVVSGRRGIVVAARDEEGAYGEEFPARRNTPKSRTHAGRPERPAASGRKAGSKPAGSRQPQGATSPGASQKKSAGPARTPAPKGGARGSAATGRSAAGRSNKNSTPKGRNRS